MDYTLWHNLTRIISVSAGLFVCEVFRVVPQTNISKQLPKFMVQLETLTSIPNVCSSWTSKKIRWICDHTRLVEAMRTSLFFLIDDQHWKRRATIIASRSTSCYCISRTKPTSLLWWWLYLLHMQRQLEVIRLVLSDELAKLGLEAWRELSVLFHYHLICMNSFIFVWFTNLFVVLFMQCTSKRFCESDWLDWSLEELLEAIASEFRGHVVSSGKPRGFLTVFHMRRLWLQHWKALR